MLYRAAVAGLVAFAVALPADGAERRGSVAFHYGPLTPAQLAWFGRFDVLVTHDPLPADQVAALHRAGTRLVLYEWAVAFYKSLAANGSWQRRLLGNSRTLLNRQPLRGCSGSETSDAFYFDPASSEHTNERPRAIAQRLAAIGYDGVFLDTTTFEHVHPTALAEYRRRHPDLPYDDAFSRFMRRLRRELRGGIVITNQGYRAADDYLPYVDYDVSESLITRPVAGGYALRPWNDPNDAWNSIDVLMRRLIAPAARRYPRVRFVHLNYGDETETVIAIARLYDTDAFVAHPDVTSPANENTYFLDLGKPRGPIVRGHGTAYRKFANGIVAVNFTRRAAKVGGIELAPGSGRLVRSQALRPPRADGGRP